MPKTSQGLHFSQKRFVGITKDRWA